VVLGFSLALGGLVISAIGMTTVFVPQDLGFLRATAEELKRAGDGLIPLIAHDRAGFGGTLLADGITLLWIALSGFKEGERWVWWMLFLSGLPAFVAAIGIHYAVGYTDQLHLLPAYFAALLYLAGLAASFSYFHANRVKPVMPLRRNPVKRNES
jgi:dihydroorotate dehydrogenase